jgi:hypothetical protein
LAAIISYYYSIYLVNKDLTNQIKKEGNLQQNLGTFAIEDFDVAMKSQLPVKAFRKYILEHLDHYRQPLIKMVYQNE